MYIFRIIMKQNLSVINCPSDKMKGFMNKDKITWKETKDKLKIDKIKKN